MLGHKDLKVLLGLKDPQVQMEQMETAPSL